MTRDRTLLLRHDSVRGSSWALPMMEKCPDTGMLSGVPTPLQGSFFAEYHTRKKGTNKGERRPDSFHPFFHEARISRHLGFKVELGYPTYVYWRHIPIARFVSDPQDPHIFITRAHLGQGVEDGQLGGSPLRAYQGLAPLLDYLMTGIRFSQRGVERYGKEPLLWPSHVLKPAILIKVAGRGTNDPFWAARSVEFMSNDQLGRIGGRHYDAPNPFGIAGLT